MDVAMQTVRHFNRTVTQRVGALNEQFLGRGRPLGASRVLWEISEGCHDVRALRARLDLDSGYLSRLLRTLEREGLVIVGQSPGDGRVREVRLTDAGRAERDTLDERADELARALLEPLDGARRARLVEAMETVERLLTAGLVEIGVDAPTSVDAHRCLEAYFAELDARFEGGFELGRSVAAEAADLVEPAGLLLVARLRGEPVGCGALRLLDEERAYIKRMWIAASARGLGLGRRLLEELERRAREHGATIVQLETNRSLTEAIALYRSAGYVEVEPFNAFPHAHHWFEKRF